MNGSDGTSRLSRRTLLRATSGAVALSAVGTAKASGGDARGRFSGRCPDATIRPSMGHCAGASTEGCADDHPVTIELREAVSEMLETRYPDAGALLEAGFKPYFDTLDGDDDGWSHWLSPEFIGDDAVLDPDRPESVLVDNDTWRSIGVMFIATRDGEPIEPLPAVYDEGGDSRNGDREGGDGVDSEAEHHGDQGDHDHRDDHDDHGRGDHDHPHGDPDRCSPWHYHAGLPGRFAWWYYRQAYERDFEDSDLEFPCRTPCMLHVWTVDHPDGVYAHDAPPPAYRPQEPADDPDLAADATPGEDELGWDVVPDDVVPDRTPESFSPGEWFGS